MDGGSALAAALESAARLAAEMVPGRLVWSRGSDWCRVDRDTLTVGKPGSRVVYVIEGVDLEAVLT